MVFLFEFSGKSTEKWPLAPACSHPAGPQKEKPAHVREELQRATETDETLRGRGSGPDTGLRGRDSASLGLCGLRSPGEGDRNPSPKVTVGTQWDNGARAEWAQGLARAGGVPHPEDGPPPTPSTQQSLLMPPHTVCDVPEVPEEARLQTPEGSPSSRGSRAPGHVTLGRQQVGAEEHPTPPHPAR